MNRVKIIFIVISFGLLRCGSRELTARDAALTYCECMKANGAPEHYVEAGRHCDSLLAKESRIYYLLEMDRISKKSLDVSRQTRDSMHTFLVEFYQELILNCCRTTLMCPDPARQKDE